MYIGLKKGKRYTISKRNFFREIDLPAFRPPFITGRLQDRRVFQIIEKDHFSPFFKKDVTYFSKNFWTWKKLEKIAIFSDFIYRCAKIPGEFLISNGSNASRYPQTSVSDVICVSSYPHGEK